MEVNDLGFVATILFVLVPSVFLIILYIQTASRQGRKDCCYFCQAQAACKKKAPTAFC